MLRIDKKSEIACSLNDDEFHKRRALSREYFRNSVISLKRSELTLSLKFKQTPTLRTDIESFIELEQQCCGFLTFTISPKD